MAQTLAPLIAQMEEAQAALVALVRADLEAEIETQAEQIVARAGAMREAMLRLGHATEQLATHARTHGLPEDARERIQTWQREIAALLGALQAKTADAGDRSALIRETLTRLTQVSKGFEGYRTKAEPPKPRFIRGQA